MLMVSQRKVGGLAISLLKLSMHDNLKSDSLAKTSLMLESPLVCFCVCLSVHACMCMCIHSCVCAIVPVKFIKSVFVRYM